MPDYIYRAEVIRIVDGDTVHLKVYREWVHQDDFGFYMMEEIVVKKSTELSFRLAGINTPELKGTTYAAGLASKNELARLLSQGSLRAVTHKPDKYGRWLVDLYVTPTVPIGGPDNTPQEIWVNKALLDGGFAVVYKD